jgi:hypothetical protein
MSEIRPIPKGMKRQWTKCRTCGNVAYYDYLPYGLSNPVMSLPCHHGVGGDFNRSITRISADEALAWFASRITSASPGR